MLLVDSVVLIVPSYFKYCTPTNKKHTSQKKFNNITITQPAEPSIRSECVLEPIKIADIMTVGVVLLKIITASISFVFECGLSFRNAYVAVMIVMATSSYKKERKKEI